MSLLGYDVDRLQLEGVTPPAIRIRDVYVGLERNAAAVARVRNLALHPASLPGDDLGYIAQLAAIGTADATPRPRAFGLTLRSN